MVLYRGEDHPRMQRLYDQLMRSQGARFFFPPELFLDALADAFPAPFVARQRL